MKWYSTDNRRGVALLSGIPVADYPAFREALLRMLEREECHVAEYFAAPMEGALQFFALVADDATGQVHVASHRYEYYEQTALESLTADCQALHPFEREIAELYGVRFAGNPWPKPLRHPVGRANPASTLDNYPFYHIAGESLHEVNVGPIHAGVIEPGAFRFICNGEQVLHLEIALGYQHRDVETLICKTGSALRRACLAESVAGDSAIAHATAHALAMERLAGVVPPLRLDQERAVMLELERIAMHLADTGALCTDIAYQLGQVACEALRTVVINTSQRVCGNRFGKTMVRPAGSRYTISAELADEVRRNIKEVVRRFDEVREDLKTTPSVLARFEECGTVTAYQARAIGAVGMAARASGVGRDVRRSHPWGAYGELINHEPVTREHGDVMSRLTVRTGEVMQSAAYVLRLLDNLEGTTPQPDYGLRMQPGALSFALVEGWRGEVCHVALTDAAGELAAYKIKDPSVHNWLALALAVRGAGISDFPINNKSFNLSYCGHDL